MIKSALSTLLFCLVWLPHLFGQGSISNIQDITAGSIPMYSKFEVGIGLNKTFTNPYNPGQVSIEMQLTSPGGKVYTVYGFYYQDFQRTNVLPYWTPISTPLDWRVRFTPNEVGQWRYTIIIRENKGLIVSTSAIRNFTCVSSSNHGFITKASNNKYFEFSDKTSFFGIAEDLGSYVGTSAPQGCDPNFSTYFTYSQHVLPKYKTWITNFAQNGGNLIRVWMTPWGFELEWPETNTITNVLGNYSGKQYRAFDLDSVFEICRQNNVFIHLVVMNPDQLATQFVDSGAPVDYGWAGNPYKLNIPLTEYREFFTNATAKDYFKYKLRYIQSRWGYSPLLANYEIINELDWVNHNGDVLSANRNEIRTWYDEMGSYLKSFYPSHLINVSFAIGFSGEYTGINALNSIDFTNGHTYSSDKNIEYQRNYFAQNNLKKFNKPFVMSEYGLMNSIGCWISEYTTLQDLHNTLWSSTLSGSATTGYYFGADMKYNNSCWGGDLIKTYKPLAKFIQNETFNSLNYSFSPIGNALSVYNSYGNPNLNQNRPPDAPSFDDWGYAPPSWALDVNNTPLNLDYLVRDISTNDDRNIQAFGLKNQNKVLGWVGNKNNYWYNVPHNADNGSIPNPCTVYNNSATANYPANMTPLQNKTLTISNLRCKGYYKIEWYSTQYNYDINGDGINDDGGIIPAFTEYKTSSNGTLTLDIPKLQPIELNQTPYAPDYGFKIVYQGNGGYANGLWQHDYTDRWVTPSSTQAIAKPAGNFAINPKGNDIFFHGTDGYLQHFYWDPQTKKWLHDGLVANWWTQPTAYRVAIGSPICINSKGEVFYKGEDGRLQHYSWNSSTGWIHDYTGGLSGNYQVGNSIVINTVNNDDQIFYDGSDGFMHHFYRNGAVWLHDGLVSNWASQPAVYKVAAGGPIAVNSKGEVFYKGRDGSLQHYSWNGTWAHYYTGGNSTYQVGGNISINLVNGDDQIFYHGSDNLMHHFYRNGTSWVHDGLVPNYLTQPAAYQLAAGSPIAVNSIGEVFYKGQDGRMQHYYWNGTWAHDYTGGYGGNYQVSGNVSINLMNGDNQIYYPGPDGYMYHFYRSGGSWINDGLVLNWWNQPVNYKVSEGSPIKITSDGQVFYRGQDGRMQHYSLDNPCEYFGSGKKEEEYQSLGFPVIQEKAANVLTDNETYSIELYPNPAKSEINVRLTLKDKNSDVKVIMLDAYGRVVRSNELNRNSDIYIGSFDVMNQANGIYLVQVFVNSRLLGTKKVMVNH